MNPPTNWLPGVIVLGGGLLVAVLFLLVTRQKAKPSPAVTDGTLDDLTRRAQVLIEELKELTADRHHLSDEQFAAEKGRLEQEAAAALRARDEYARGLDKQAAAKAKPSGKRAEKAAEAPTGFFARHPELKGALWGGGVVLFFVVLGLLLTQNERQRGENESATGRVPPGMQSSQQTAQATSEDAELKAALEQVKAHPENVDAAAEVAHELLRQQQWEQANAITERALGVDPFHVENRIHRALLKAVRGDTQGAVRDFRHLADTYPDGYEALLFLGSVAGNNGDLRGALDAFERFAAEAPADAQPPQLAQGISMLRAQLGVK